MTPLGIEPTTFLFVAQCLSEHHHCVPHDPAVCTLYCSDKLSQHISVKVYEYNSLNTLHVVLKSTIYHTHAL